MSDAAADLKLIHTRLIKLELNSYRAYVDGEIKIVSSKLNVSSTLDKSKHHITVQMNYEVSTQLNGADLFKLRSEFEGVFGYTETLAFETVQTFAKLNAPAIIYPYLRASISVQTVSGGFPPLNVPIINFQKLPVQVSVIE